MNRMVNSIDEPLNMLKKLQKTYEDTTKEMYDGTTNYFIVIRIEPYYELIIKKVSSNNHVIFDVLQCC